MSAVRTWADGFGRWYAEVPDTLDAPEVARDAIESELRDRGLLADGTHVPRIDRCVTPDGAECWREAWA